MKPPSPPQSRAMVFQGGLSVSKETYIINAHSLFSQAYETLAKLEGRNNKTVSPSQEGSSGQEDSSVHNISYVDYHYEASEFEKKLIQVAEMHGELLEFNEHLQVCSWHLSSL